MGFFFWFFFGLNCTFTDATCPQVFPLPTVPKISGRKLGEAIYYLKEQVTVSYAVATEAVTLQVRNRAILINIKKNVYVSLAFMTSLTQKDRLQPDARGKTPGESVADLGVEVKRRRPSNSM